MLWLLCSTAGTTSEQKGPCRVAVAKPSCLPWPPARLADCINTTSRSKIHQPMRLACRPLIAEWLAIDRSGLRSNLSQSLVAVSSMTSNTTMWSFAAINTRCTGCRLTPCLTLWHSDMVHIAYCLMMCTYNV